MGFEARLCYKKEDEGVEKEEERRRESERVRKRERESTQVHKHQGTSHILGAI